MRGSQPQGGIKSKGALLLELARELRDLREELEEKRYDRNIPDANRRETSQATAPSNDSHKHQQQRPSLISLFTGTTGQQTHSHISAVPVDSRSGSGGICTPSDTTSQQTLHPPRESLSSGSTGTNKEHVTSETHSIEVASSITGTILTSSSNKVIAGTTPISGAAPTGSLPHLSHSYSLHQQSYKIQPPKLRFVSSVEFRHSSGETSTTPLSPESPADESSGEQQRPRLQRSKASSRKTFRLKRGRQTHGEIAPHAYSVDHSHERPKPLNEISWDSVSQTSSTSGYRDNNSLQTGLLSPDGSLGGVTLGRSPSQHSLLMLFEAQDEDTLI